MDSREKVIQTTDSSEVVAKGMSLPDVSLNSPFYPHIYNRSFNRDQKKILKSNNALTKILRSLHVRIVSDINEAEILWRRFSPNNSVFDTWEFRYAYWLTHQFPVHFVTLELGSETVGVLPLWFNTDYNWYTWFGSNWHEDNSFFVLDPMFTPLLLAVAPKPIELDSILPQATEPFSHVISFLPDEPKYILKISETEDFEGCISHFSKKRRYNIRRDIRRIESLNPKIIFNDYSHYKNLINLSTKRMDAIGQDSYWNDNRKIETFKTLIEQDWSKANFSLRMISCLIGDTIAASDLVVVYNNTYTPLVGGNNLKDFSGIGTYMNFVDITDALNLGIRTIDFLQENYGWKEVWCEPQPLVKFKIEP